MLGQDCSRSRMPVVVTTVINTITHGDTVMPKTPSLSLVRLHNTDDLEPTGVHSLPTDWAQRLRMPVDARTRIGESEGTMKLVPLGLLTLLTAIGAPARAQVSVPVACTTYLIAYSGTLFTGHVTPGAVRTFDRALGASSP